MKLMEGANLENLVTSSKNNELIENLFARINIGTAAERLKAGSLKAMRLCEDMLVYKEKQCRQYNLLVSRIAAMPVLNLGADVSIVL